MTSRGVAEALLGGLAGDPEGLADSGPGEALRPCSPDSGVQVDLGLGELGGGLLDVLDAERGRRPHPINVTLTRPHVKGWLTPVSLGGVSGGDDER